MAIEVRWCPECDEPHIGGCPWAELEKRADPTVPMPEPGPTVREQVAEKIREDMEALVASFTRIGQSAERHFALHFLAPFVAIASLAFAGYSLAEANHAMNEAAMMEVEARSRETHRTLLKMEMKIERERAIAEAMRERLIEAERDAEIQYRRIHELTEPPR